MSERWSTEQYQEYLKKQNSKKPSKFNNARINHPKYGAFDSKKEFYRYLELLNMQKNGQINGLNRQTMFIVIESSDTHKKTAYFADFTYFRDGEYVVEDVKSEITRKQSTYIMKKKLMKTVHGIDILET